MADRHSRRSFLLQTGVAAALAGPAYGLAGAGVASAESAARSGRTRREPLGIALVGLGYYSTDLLGPALRETTDVALRGIVTGTPAKAERWQEEYDLDPSHVYSYETFDDLAKDDAIDIVYVVLPNAMHAEYTIRAARAGKHVICEKPMAVSAAECEAMIRACEDAGVTLSIGYRMHFEPTTQEVMRIAAEQRFGPMRIVTAGAGYRESRADHWKLGSALGGGALMDMGVYPLQAARYVTGEEPVAVSAQTFTDRPELFAEVDETTTFQLTFPSGAVASLYTTFGANMNHLRGTAAQGWLRLEPFSAYRGIRGATSDGPLDFPVINQQAAQMDETARAIRDGRPMRVPGEEGLRDLRVVEAIRASIVRGGATVALG